MPYANGVGRFAEHASTRRIPATPGLLRSTSLASSREVRVTARPSGIGSFTPGTVRNTGTAPAIRYAEGPRSRSDAFHSLPTPVRYGGPATAKGKRKRGDNPLRRSPGANLRRGWPGRS